MRTPPEECCYATAAVVVAAAAAGDAAVGLTAQAAAVTTVVVVAAAAVESAAAVAGVRAGGTAAYWRWRLGRRSAAAGARCQAAWTRSSLRRTTAAARVCRTQPPRA